MRGERGEALVLAHLETLAEASPCAGDVRLALSVDCHGFAGHVKAWFEAAAWRSFLEALAALERSRAGAAELEAIDPEVARLRFEAHGATGGVLVSGALGRPQDGCAVRFGFELSGERVGAALRSLRALA